MEEAKRPADTAFLPEPEPLSAMEAVEPATHTAPSQERGHMVPHYPYMMQEALAHRARVRARIAAKKARGDWTVEDEAHLHEIPTCAPDRRGKR